MSCVSCCVVFVVFCVTGRPPCARPCAQRRPSPPLWTAPSPPVCAAHIHMRSNWSMFKPFAVFEGTTPMSAAFPTPCVVGQISSQLKQHHRPLQRSLRHGDSTETDAGCCTPTCRGINHVAMTSCEIVHEKIVARTQKACCKLAAPLHLLQAQAHVAAGEGARGTVAGRRTHAAHIRVALTACATFKSPFRNASCFGLLAASMSRRAAQRCVQEGSPHLRRSRGSAWCCSASCWPCSRSPA